MYNLCHDGTLPAGVGAVFYGIFLLSEELDVNSIREEKKEMKNMKKVTPVIVTMIIFLLAVLTCSCSPAEEKKVPANTVTVTDSAGRTVEVPQPLERVIVLSSDHAVPLKCIGVSPDKVVGISKYVADDKEILPEISKKAQVGSSFSPNLEKIVELNPQVIFAYVKWPGPDKLEKKLPGEIKVVRLDLYKPETMKREIKLLGRMFGQEEEAEKYAGFWFSKIEAIEKKVKDLKEGERVRVYYEHGVKPYHTCSQGSGYHQLVEMAGGINIARGLVGGYPEVDPEWVIEQNPGVIIRDLYGHAGFGNPDAGPLKKSAESLKERPGFGEIKAVKEGEVYTFTHSLWGGSFKNIGACYLAKVFYPELFKDLDPEKYLKEHMEKYLGVEYERAKGAFIYPELK